MLLAGKVVVISGVGPGMGGKLARLAAAEGARVALGSLAADRPVMDAAVAAIVAAGGQALARDTDVTDPGQCRALAAAAEDAFGRIDGLVNIAYRMAWSRFEDADLADWQRSHDVTFWGALRMVQAVLPALRRAGGGAIVNVSTQGSVRPLPRQGDYATAKGALNAATRTLALELGRDNIRVVTARMGRLWGVPLQRALEARAAERGVPVERLVEEMRAGIALGVVPTDEDCARGVLMLLSDHAGMVTGATLDINGGEYMAP